MFSRTVVIILIGFIAFIGCERNNDTASNGEAANNPEIEQTSQTDRPLRDGVPVLPQPGSKIDAAKVDSILEQANTSFSTMATAREAEQINQNISILDSLLEVQTVKNDPELQFTLKGFLAGQYFRLSDTAPENHLGQVVEHVQSAISLLEDQPAYKADLADAYSLLIATYNQQGKYEQSINLQKMLIADYQGIGSYENWFAANAVEILYNMTRQIKDAQLNADELISYLHEVGERYENEVGIAALIVLARHYHTQGDQHQIQQLKGAIESQLNKLDNDKFEEEKWLPLKYELQHTAVTDAKADTLYFTIQPEMIQEVELRSAGSKQSSRHFVDIMLKQEYHREFLQLTGENMGNYLVVEKDGQVLSPSFPKILSAINGGRLSLGEFETEEQAQEAVKKLSS